MSNKKSHKRNKRKTDDEAADGTNEMEWDLEKPPRRNKHKKLKSDDTRKNRDSSSSSSSSDSTSSSSSSNSSSASSSSGNKSTKGKQETPEAPKKASSTVADRVEKDKSSALQESTQHKSKWDSPDERRRQRSRSRQRDARRHQPQQQQHNRERVRERHDDYYNDRKRDYGGPARGRYEYRQREETRYRRSRSRTERDSGGGGGGGAGGRGRYNERRRSRSRSRSARREREPRAKRDYSPRPPQQRRQRRNSREDDKNYEWGKKGDRVEKSMQDGKNNSPQEKDKPNFALSGALTEDANKVNGVVVKYAEPLEARKPKRRWRLYPFKGETALPILHIHRQSCFLVGRDRKVVDLAVDHPSCSKQHAALQYRLVPFERDDGTQGKRVRLYLIDLESANGTFINSKKIDARKYYELIEKDVIKFGFSTREYVLLHENSKEDQEDDDVLVKQEIKEEVEPA